jgi:heme exporter protein A
MNNYSIELNNIVKYFGRRLIFNDINFNFSSSNIYGISGPNGSGKSTLVKIIACLISATKGKVVHTIDTSIVDPDLLYNYMGFVSPYLNLYDEFTAEENLIHFSHIKGSKFDKEYSGFLLNELNLFERRDDLVRGYSSGMKQRLKFAFALLNKPLLLIFDEPTSNLDNEGKDKVYRLIENEAKNNLVIIASNEVSDLKLCGKFIELEQFKK